MGSSIGTTFLLIILPAFFPVEGWRDPGEKGQHVRLADDYEQDWGRVFRLVFISGLATLTTMGNIFTISAIIVDDLLRKKGNSFLASMTLADLLITGLVLPASSVAVLGEMEDSENICRLQYGLASVSCLTAAMFTGIIGIENFLRLKGIRLADEIRERQVFQQPPGQAQYPHSSHQYQQHASLNSNHQSYPPSLLIPLQHPFILKRQPICTVWQVTVLNLSVWLISGVIVLIHFIFMPQIMITICEKPKPPMINTRLNEQLLFESLVVYGITTLSFLLLGGLGFLKTLSIMRSWTKPKPFLTSREFALVGTNGWNWLVRLLIWIPALLITILSILNESEKRSYQFHNRQFPTTVTSPTGSENSINFQRLLVWPAILPSCLSSFVNLLSNRDFRRCYVQLFHYCCCKTSVALSRRPRDPLRAGSDVRVHIIPGYNMYNSSVVANNEIASTAVQTRFNIKCSPIRMNYKQRDIYEL